MDFSVIAAADENMGIGTKNKLPWRLKGDLAYFSRVTSQAQAHKTNAVIMGSNTWLSIPKAHRPLPDRINVVLSRKQIDLPEGVILASSFEDAFEKLGAQDDLDEVFVIGGAGVYAQAIARLDCKKVYLTEVTGTFNCDTFFPRIPRDFKKISESEMHEEKGISFKFAVYERS